MASYYYLVATLPSLRYDGTPPFSVEKFVSLCKEHVGKHDFQTIEAAIRQRPSNHSFLKQWQHFESMLKKELNDQRSRKLGLNSSIYKNDGDKEHRIAEVVRQAVQNEDVLASENALLLLQWKFLDELSALHTFDVEGLLSYALKLTLLERKSLFIREEGNTEFKRLFSNLQSEIENN